MRYTQIATAKPFEGLPKINLASIIGASPNKPILIKIPVTGKRPLEITVDNLPQGLTLNGDIITGKIDKQADYTFTIFASNELGKTQKTLTLEIKPNNVCLTPLLGWTSWNAFAYQVTQKDVEDTAEIMLKSGITEYGYNFVNTDSGWQGQYGGKFDAVMPNEKFPDIKGMVDRLHQKGFKCGIYSTPMLNAFGCSMDAIPLPPGCTQGEPDDRFADERGGVGVIRKEKNNALQWEEWGFDYLKYDWRPCDPINAELMRKELASLNRDMGFCVSVRARPEYHTYWAKYCNSYRNNPDSIATWDNLLEIYRTYFDFIDYVNKGHFFDLDMLDTGKCYLFEFLEYFKNPKHGFNEDEQIVSYSIRAFLNSPIQISSNLSFMDEFELSLYCNEEVIAINQDCAFDFAKPVLLIEQGDKIIHVWKKRLENGDLAYMLLNLGEGEQTVKVHLDERYNVRDVWAKTDLKPTATLNEIMPPHTVKILRLSK